MILGLSKRAEKGGRSRLSWRERGLGFPMERPRQIRAESPMAIRRTTIMTSTGVRLIQIDTVLGDRPTDRQYRLTTLRQAQPRLFADRALADEAFAAEVQASKLDPTALKLAVVGL